MILLFTTKRSKNFKRKRAFNSDGHRCHKIRCNGCKKKRDSRIVYYGNEYYQSRKKFNVSELRKQI